MAKLRRQLEESNTEIEELKKIKHESENSHRSLQNAYDQLKLTNQKLLADNQSQVSIIISFYDVRLHF